FQQEVEDPAFYHVFAWVTAVVEDVSVGAARLLEGIGEYGKLLESVLGGNGPSDPQHTSPVPGQPGKLDGNRATLSMPLGGKACHLVVDGRTCGFTLGI